MKTFASEDEFDSSGKLPGDVISKSEERRVGRLIPRLFLHTNKRGKGFDQSEICITH